jgi:two-component system sensor histidine kinase UhpB
MRTRPHGLLWRLSIINVSVLLTILILLIVTPITLHAPPKPVEAAILLAGFVVITVADLWLLRRAVAPVEELSEVMRVIDPMEPGRRLDAEHLRDAELVELATSFNSMLDRLENERRGSARRALSAQEAERRRIARELHDEIGQNLTAIALEAERAALTPDSGSWERIAGLAQESVEDLRRIARRLRPEALDDLGLVNAFIALTNRVGEYGSVRIERRLPDQLPEHAPELDIVLYRVAQEALTNVVRHAEASHALLELRVEEHTLVLVVRDDGRGFRPEDVDERSSGLSGMRERALLAGGSVTIASTPGRGTEVTLVVPRGGS